jgi:predicted ATPase
LHGLYWLTAELARESGVMLAVDDAQWGDLPSLRYLAYVAERVEDLPVVLIATIRHGEEVDDPVAILASRAETIRLHELSLSASVVLAREELGGGAADSFCEACHRATGGNPFLLKELLVQLRRDGIEPSAERAAEVGQATPLTVTRSVLLRLSRLPA